ncbi:sensor domain-containing diguanylate cyclase [Halioxenophilus aromaticivorans]|uniref:GGDEF domain-containing protein n=1 Tax=Halioxenophilus aromaticivorans TaxID=1306992 RepID=A0AAV3U0M1_9ALTE
MPLRFHNSLVYRALKFFLLLIAVIGGIALVVNYSLASAEIKHRSLSQIKEVLNAIEPSAQISAYLNDKSIAREIGRGLIKNPIISQVDLINSDGHPLVSISRGKRYTDSDTKVQRRLSSPFDSSVAVGTLSVVLDSDKLNQEKMRYLISVLAPTFLQTLAVAIAMVWTGLAVLLPKVRVFLKDIEDLEVQNGQKLDANKYQVGGEIARITEYINGLIDRMFAALNSERELRQASETQHKQIAAIIENARSGIFVADKTGKLLSLNQACQAIGLRHGNALSPGCNIVDMLPPSLDGASNQITKCLGKAQKLHLEIFLPPQNGKREMWLQLNLTPIDQDTAQGVINDITALKSESIAAQTLARTDPLTQLGNRLGFETEFNRRLANTGDGKQSLTLMSIDLDQFKAVNDTYGHDTGDQVLIYVAHQLQQITRNSDYICRMGGDEFNIVLDDISQEMSAKLAGRIVGRLQEAIVLQPDQSVQIGASIGVVFVPKGGKVLADDLLRKADKTMYQVKHGGRNNFAVVNFVDNTNELSDSKEHTSTG